MDGAGEYDDWQDTVSELRRWFEQQQAEAEQAKAEAFAELSSFARSAGAPSELREAQERIDLGLLTWEGVLTGEGTAASRLIDARLTELAPLARAIRDGASPEEAAAAFAKGAGR